MRTKIIVLIVAVVVVLGAVWWFVRPKGQPLFSGLQTTSAPAPTIDHTKLIGDYQTNAKAIIADFAQRYRGASATDKVTIANDTQTKLLALSGIPPEEQSLHLGLVIALSHMANGQVANGQADYDALVNKTSWLGAGDTI